LEASNDAIFERAKFLARHSDRDDLRSIVLLVMYDLGLPLHYTGFDYMKNLLPIALRDPSQIVIKELFLKVGILYIPPVGYFLMEKSIRSMILKAWSDKQMEKWRCYFPEYMLQGRKPPSNLEFIAALVYFLEMWQGCCKEEAYAG